MFPSTGKLLLSTFNHKEQIALVRMTRQNVACNKELPVFMHLLSTGTLGLLAAWTPMSDRGFQGFSL
jgi:hypothetical protein